MKTAIIIAVLTLFSQLSLQAQEAFSFDNTPEAEWGKSEVVIFLEQYILIIIAVAGVWLGKILLGHIFRAFSLSNPV